MVIASLLIGFISGLFIGAAIGYHNANKDLEELSQDLDRLEKKITQPHGGKDR